MPTWVGDPAAATIAPGIATTVPITLRPNVMTRTTVDFVQPVRAIYSGAKSWTTYAVMQDGTVRAWGANSYGQLGDGTRIVATTPRVVVGLNGPTQIAAALEFACATSPNGLWCWGSNYDQLADGDTSLSLVPRNNPDVEPDAIAAGSWHVCGRIAGTVRCWGTGFLSGTGGLNGPSVEATSFATGDDFSLAGRGLLAVSSFTTLSRSSVASPGASYESLRERVVSVSLGDGSYCAIAAGGAVLCAGGNVLGAGPITSAPFDAPVPNGVTGATALASGGSHHCALLADRTVVCWGANNFGQVGAGIDVGVASTPAAVPLRDVVQVAAGFNHTCALVADGSVWCWGLNSEGQLGDGTNVPRFTPVRVRF